MQRLEIPNSYLRHLPKKRLPTLNEIITMHYRTYTKLKKNVFALIDIAVKKQRLHPIEEYPVHVNFYWYVADRRTDPDNISAAGRKLILDGLQRSGILSNDGWRQFISSQEGVMPFREFYALDKDNPRIVIESNPVEDNNAKSDSRPLSRSSQGETGSA